MSKGPSSHTTTTMPQIPNFLQPFINESANYSEGALKALADQLSQPNALVTPFNENQIKSQNMALDIANGGGGFIPTAQNVMMDTATNPAAQVVGEMAVNRLNNYGGRGTLTSFANNPFQLNQNSNSVLSDTTRGNYLYGNPGFNAAVDAAIRKVQPTIASTFSSGGSGRLNSGLAKTAMTQAATDSFASLFNQERDRQLSAAGQLGSFQLQGNQQQINAANSLSARDITSASTLGSLADSERDRQLQAARELPALGLLPSSIYESVGNVQQNQSEREKRGSVEQYQQLLQAAFGGMDPAALFGQTSTQPIYQNRGGKFLGGGLTGLSIANLIPGLGPIAGLIGGGLIGAFG